MRRKAFTMIELIFVIVVLGILAAVALPRLGSTIESGYIASAQGDVAAIRASIASARQNELIRGSNRYISSLSTGTTNLFDGNGSISVLTYPIVADTTGGWSREAGTENYTFTIDTGNAVVFTYYPNRTTVAGVVHAAGTFDCDHSEALCQKIAE